MGINKTKTMKSFKEFTEAYGDKNQERDAKENKSLKLKQFKTYNEEVDAINNTSFSKTYPELAEWYEAI